VQPLLTWSVLYRVGKLYSSAASALPSGGHQKASQSLALNKLEGCLREVLPPPATKNKKKREKKRCLFAHF